MRVTRAQYDQLVSMTHRRHNDSGIDSAQTQGLLRVAVSLARRGRLHEAEQTLAAVPLNSPLAPQVLDLKARIFAQQGRLVEAQQCWLEAVRQDPGNRVYRGSLDYVTRDLRPSRIPLMFVTVGLVTVLLVLLILAWLVG